MLCTFHAHTLLPPLMPATYWRVRVCVAHPADASVTVLFYLACGLPSGYRRCRDDSAVVMQRPPGFARKASLAVGGRISNFHDGTWPGEVAIEPHARAF